MGSLALFGAAVLLNLVLTIFLLHQLGQTREQVDDLRVELASKQDVAMLRPVRVSQILEQRCERCHSDRRFARLSGLTRAQTQATIRRMAAHPGADIPADEARSIEAALLLFRCTSCHGEEALSRVLLMPPDERVRFLRQKVRMPGSGFRTDQIGELVEAFQVLTSPAFQ